jgi:hypothetical protein
MPELLPEGPNLYRYAANCPLRWRDALGLSNPATDSLSANPEIVAACAGEEVTKLTAAETLLARTAFGTGGRVTIEALWKIPADVLRKIERVAYQGIKKASEGVRNACSKQGREAALKQVENQINRREAVKKVLEELGEWP